MKPQQLKTIGKWLVLGPVAFYVVMFGLGLLLYAHNFGEGPGLSTSANHPTCLSTAKFNYESNQYIEQHNATIRNHPRVLYYLDVGYCTTDSVLTAVSKLWFLWVAMIIAGAIMYTLGKRRIALAAEQARQGTSTGLEKNSDK